MEIVETTSTSISSTTFNILSNDDTDSDEYEEEVTYIIADLGTEVTLDMITNNFEILNNVNPSFNFNKSRQDSTSTLNPQQKTSDSNLNDNTNNETNDTTILTSTTKTPYHYHTKPSTSQEKESSKGAEPSNFNKKENNDIDYSLIGLDTDIPYLRIGNIHFKGEYDETIGTDLIFFPEPDPMNPRQQKLTYQCQTTKKIKFSQINLQEINLDTMNQFNINDDNEWEDKYSINNKNYSLNNQELFNIRSDLHDNSNDEDGESDDNSHNETVVDKVIVQEKEIETSTEEDQMKID